MYVVGHNRNGKQLVSLIMPVYALIEYYLPLIRC